MQLDATVFINIEEKMCRKNCKVNNMQCEIDGEILIWSYDIIQKCANAK
jgi:hypothetical protein